MKSLTEKLQSSEAECASLTKSLSASDSKMAGLETELQEKNMALSEVKGQLEETQNRLMAMEEDAGAEFRSKVRLLERKLADATAKVRR